MMIVGRQMRLREKRTADAANDYAWQTDTELSALDASPVLKINYTQYQADYTGELRYSFFSRQRFAIETLDGKHIGNCAYYGINGDKGETEVGVMIGNRDYWDKGYGTDVVTTLVNHIFRHTKLNRIYLKTLDWNVRAQKCFQKCGFTLYNHVTRDGYNFVLMELYRYQWEKKQQDQPANIPELAGGTAPDR